MRCINVTAGSICTIMVNGNEWEERKMGRATEQEQDQQRAVRGVAKLCSLASFFFFFLFMDTNFGIPTRQGSSQSFFWAGEGGFLFSKERFGWTLLTQCNSSI